jgi:hypothetical protein
LAGQDVHDAILAALDDAKVVVVIWSDTATRSPWVRDEATRAARQNKLVTTHVPAFDLGDLPLGFGQRHSTDVGDRPAVVRALASLGVLGQSAPIGSRADRGRDLLTRVREIGARDRATQSRQAQERVLGPDPESKKLIMLRVGRFGPYVERDQQHDGHPSKRSAIPRDVDPDAVDLAFAVRLLSLPRELGLHPQSGKPITAAVGRYGPYVHCDGIYARLNSSHDVFNVSLSFAAALLAERSAESSKGKPWQPPTLVKELGDHPTQGGPVLILSGRYGPYVRHGTKMRACLEGSDQKNSHLPTLSIC